MFFFQLEKKNGKKHSISFLYLVVWRWGVFFYKPPNSWASNLSRKGCRFFFFKLFSKLPTIRNDFLFKQKVYSPATSWVFLFKLVRPELSPLQWSLKDVIRLKLLCSRPCDFAGDFDGAFFGCAQLPACASHRCLGEKRFFLKFSSDFCGCLPLPSLKLTFSDLEIGLPKRKVLFHTLSQLLSKTGSDFFQLLSQFFLGANNSGKDETIFFFPPQQVFYT